MSGRWALGLLAGLVLLVALATVTAPRPVDTSVRLGREGAAPFDAEVFAALLPGWLGAPVEPVAAAPYTHLADTTLVGTSYVFVVPAFQPDAAEARRLLAYAARGNTVFVATHVFGGPLGEALGTPDSTDDGRRGLRTDWPDDLPFLSVGRLDLADSLRLTAPGVARTYRFPVGVERSVLYGADPARTRVRGVTARGAARVDTTLVRVAVGRGAVVVCSTPLALTNAALVGAGDGVAYASAVVADLPRGRVFWSDRGTGGAPASASPLRYVLATPPLRWAYGLLLAAGLLYVAFRGRRWQRPIPVVAPPPNAQREFARTVGRLYLAHGDGRRLAARKQRVVLDRLRGELRIAEPDASPATARLAAARAGADPAATLRLFAALRRLPRAPRVRPDELVALDRQIDALFSAARDGSTRPDAARPAP